MIGILLIIASGNKAVRKNYATTDGSRGDGTIDLSYEYGLNETPIVDKDQGDELAKKRCLGWGYTGAESFDSGLRNCIQGDGYNCITWRVTLKYQCTRKDEVIDKINTRPSINNKNSRCSPEQILEMTRMGFTAQQVNAACN